MEHLNPRNPLQTPLSDTPYEYAPDGQTAPLGDFGWCFQAARGIKGLTTLLLNNYQFIQHQQEGSASQTLAREHGNELFAALSVLSSKLVASLEEWRFYEGDDEQIRQQHELERNEVARQALLVWQSQVRRLARFLRDWPPGPLQEQLLSLFGPWLERAQLATDDHRFDGPWWTDVYGALVLMGKTLDGLCMTMGESKRLAVALQPVTEQALMMQRIATRAV